MNKFVKYIILAIVVLLLLLFLVFGCSKDEEGEVVAAAEPHAPPQAEAEYRKVHEGNQHGGHQVAGLEELAPEQQHLPQEDGIPAGQVHSILSPVSLMNTSSRLDSRMTSLSEPGRS